MGAQSGGGIVPGELIKHRDSIKALNPHAESIIYDIGTWRKQLGNNQQLEHLAKHCPRQVSRAQLFRLADHALNTREIGDILSTFFSRKPGIVI